MTEVIDRHAGRVLLVDLSGRVLLFRGGDPARPGLRWWFTPGGGLEPGETTVTAACRELFEERLTITEHRWWSAAEIKASREQIVPADLAALLRGLTATAAVEDS